MFDEISRSRPDRRASTMEGRNRRRSERVVLRVPLQLSAKMPDGKRICIEAHTLVVNAHGGLMDVGMELPARQQIVLTNSRTDRVATSRIVRVERSQ